MSIDWMTALAEKLEAGAAGSRPQWDSPLDLAQALDATVKRTLVVELINQKLVDAINTPNARLMVSVSPQSGKSQLCSRWLPLWLLTRDPDARITPTFPTPRSGRPAEARVAALTVCVSRCGRTRRPRRSPASKPST